MGGLTPFMIRDPTVENAPGRVHAGMAKAWNRLSKAILPVIKNLFEFSYDETFDHLYITGHR